MGVVSALAQCVLDFLVDERCHACGASLSGEPPGRVPLAAPVEVAALARLRVTTRLLCEPCAHRIRCWSGPVVLAPRAPSPALPLHPAFVTDLRLLAVIHLLKFGRRERIAPWLARAIACVLARAPAVCGAQAPLVVPVPMDRAARRRRGFNQAESIARTLAAEWSLPFAPAVLSKVRRTKPQSALGRRERLANLDDAFRSGPGVRGRGVLLVDDLVTTGATVYACAAALRRSGASEVSVVCAGYHDARAGLPEPFLQS
jgi:ComF family protein